jgi:hypothetical protein
VPKLGFLFKLGFVAVLLYGGFHFGYLGEWSVYKNELAEICRSKGLPVPLDDARVIVSCSSLTMKVYSGETLLKSYDVAIGAGIPDGGLAERMGTPLGQYTVLEKRHRHDMADRGSRCFVLDYPRLEDAERGRNQGSLSEAEYQSCLLAARAGQPMPAIPSLGGPLTLQGNYFFFRGSRFTDGSIALSNSDVNELFDVVPEGSDVEILR